MTSEVWVWCWLPGDTTPTLAGRFEHTAAKGVHVGRFVYGRSYVANPDAQPLDPIQLLLKPKITYETTALQGFFGPIRDAMPDDWGRFVIDRLHGAQSDLTGYLLKANGDHIGCLGFSASKDTAPAQPWLPGLEIVNAARGVFAGMEEGRPVEPAMQNIVRPNTALGGARPKLTLVHKGKQWIAKFPAREDRGLPIARVECAMLQLAARCGIRAANAQVHEGDVLLVERFDRAQVPSGWRRDAFMSAQSVFFAEPDVQKYAFSGSYPRLARALSKFSEQPRADREELFRRMAFNCCTSNTDDHERNHGFVAADTPGMYVLSPAYDLVPRVHATQRRHQALGVGEEGFVASRGNVLSDCTSFGLSVREATEILDEVQARVREGWRESFGAQGLDDEQVRFWSPCFQELPTEVPT
ncbi:type II toxin-antitoxin system HipA family toxin [Ramlibacter albus]|uniref:Type II toxin-antitoxin system HipA family toxin n=1 Tax=Ramlibacter albus TaxID=2079448 RepID=A0A923ME33_9BURK|nr:type II toxin-antitoxin system HipA family toxin [Ramlibacter albus]MBC5768325.1 type II toxin-antitoxin system HipA family toxin [Ramlibacter albus]